MGKKDKKKVVKEAKSVKRQIKTQVKKILGDGEESIALKDIRERVLVAVGDTGESPAKVQGLIDSAVAKYKRRDALAKEEARKQKIPKPILAK